MKKLKLKLWRIKNIVLMEVLEQDESLRGKGLIFEKKGFQIQSGTAPALCDCKIFIQGTDDKYDNDVIPYYFISMNSAKDYIKQITDIVKAYNHSISTEPSADDIEIFIAE